ncbi:MAG TPA: dicarboxylate/amino acid:cation symporter [Candidatus Acidoferrales bacterium]|jgi:aerobic C4-dicarboxylate transport protein|nr:dicarboxylate/amino acid:cation symporter [Candidatus Acidoferrales bacterium]
MATSDAVRSALRPSGKPAVKPPFYRTLWGQVLIGVALAIVLGYLKPHTAVAMKPLGDAFIRLITMIITLVIFCTVVTGIAGMEDMKKVGRVGGKALLYFEIVSTLALLVGLVVGNVVHTGAGFNADPATLNVKAVAGYAGAAKAQSISDFLMHIIPTTVVDAFARGDILEVVFVAILFGFAISAMGERCKPLVDMFNGLTQAVFGVVNIVMKFAPIGAFGAMAFTIGQYGIASLGPLAKFIGTFWLTSFLFIVIVMGAVALAVGFNIFKFLAYIKEEIVLVLATSSSETALPTLMEKMESLGCSKSLVGLVVPTGYTFNTDGSSLYMTMAALFVAQATNTHLTLTQQLTIFAVAVLTSKGAAGVQGAAFIALVGTLMVIPSIPVAGMALILGIDRFMSMCRATVNMVGNGVATIVVARWEHELDTATLQKNMALSFEAATATEPEVALATPLAAASSTKAAEG